MSTDHPLEELESISPGGGCVASPGKNILSFTLSIEVNGKEIPMGTRNEDVCFVLFGKVSILLLQSSSLWHATFESQKLKDHSLFFFFSIFAFSSPWLVICKNIKVVPQLSQAGQCPNRKQSCGGGQMGFDVLWMKTWGHVQGPEAESREYLAKPRGISCSLPEWVFKYPEKDKRSSRSMGRPKCLCPQKPEDVCRERAVCV